MNLTIKQLKQEIQALQNKITYYMGMYKPYKGDNKKQSYIDYLDYLRIVEYGDPTLETQAIDDADLVVIPTLLECINFLASKKALIKQVTLSDVTFELRNVTYTIELTTDSIRLHSFDTYHTYRSLESIDVFADQEYIPNQETTEQHKPNIKETIITREMIDNLPDVKQTTYRNKIETRELIYFDRPTKHIQRTNNHEVDNDLKYWLSHIYIDCSTQDKRDLLDPYLTIELEQPRKNTLEFYSNLGCNIIEKSNVYGWTKTFIYFNWMIEDKQETEINQEISDRERTEQKLEKIKVPKIMKLRSTISFSFLMRYFKRSICPSDYKALYYQCPKLICLEQLLNQPVSIINKDNADLASLIHLNIGNKKPLISRYGEIMRVYDAYYVLEDIRNNQPKNSVFRTKQVDIKYLDSKLINRRGLINKHYMHNVKDSKGRSRIALSKERIDNTLSNYNSCYITYEDISGSYRKNQYGDLTLPDNIRELIEKLKVKPSNVLGKVWLQSESKLEILGIVLIKKNKLWYYELSNITLHTRQRKEVETKDKLLAIKVGEILLNKQGKKIDRVTIDPRITEIDRKNKRLVYSDLMVDKVELHQIPTEVKTLLSLHGLRDNQVITHAKIEVNWQRLTGLNLTVFKDAKYTQPYTLVS